MLRTVCLEHGAILCNIPLQLPNITFICTVVDGKFGAWGSWGPCSVTCGEGRNTRSRACDSPPASNGGTECVGDLVESADCAADPCTGKSI